MPDQPSNPNEPNKPQVESDRYSEGSDASTSELAAQSLPETLVLGTGVGEAHDSLTNEALPQSIGRYLVRKILGEGGYGCVYLAFDDELQRHVTVKVPHRNRVTTPHDVQVYLAEARTLAKLEHPNVVPVHDVGHTPDGICYIVSRFIDGSDLQRRMKSSPLSMGEAVELVATIAEALHYVHLRGVIHRDIKPGNILLDKRGVAYLADFGLALLEDEAARSNSIAGTPSYMSPEQARGENHLVQGTSDIFSLAIVLYELVTGTPLFRADNAYTTLCLVQEQEPRPLREINPDIPAELERVCMKALAKRASDRHATALDFAGDLRAFLADNDGLHLASHEIRGQLPDSQSRPISAKSYLGIVPRGLRSFGPEDAHFFLGLLPGPCDRHGIPESIRFWKGKIEDPDPNNGFRVGLIYGPSGCGKSSFILAGLIPTLANNVASVFVEAAPGATETRLLHRLRRKCPCLDTNLGLRESIASLRHGRVLGDRKKVLIVIDQFEQWLYSADHPEQAELTKALRQCDGEHVQCIVLVRDDFWLACSRFMDLLEVELLQNQNMALVDLFDQAHARRVLIEFGHAFDRLPEHFSKATRDQRAFINEAVIELSENGKVTPVRLALFVEMIKNKPWTPATLRKSGGTAGVGVMFLDEHFVVSNAPVDYRVHRKAVDATLGALMPQPGTNLKGHMKSREELMQVSGYANQPRQFQKLLRILDSELHLITLTDPEGHSEDTLSGSQSGSLSQLGYYQLAHDFLVPSIAVWRARTQRETRKGRAEIRLNERSEIWQVRPDSLHLPTWLEWLSILVYTSRDRWNETQRRMMRLATKRHVLRSLLALTVMIVSLCFLYQYSRWNYANTLTKQLTTAHVGQVQNLLDQMNGYEDWTVRSLDAIRLDKGGNKSAQLFANLALRRAAKLSADVFHQDLVTSDPETLAFLCEELHPQREHFVPPLWEILNDTSISDESDPSGRPFNRRFNAALALASYDPPGGDNAETRWEEHKTFVSDQLIRFANIDRQYYSSLIRLIRPAAPVLLDRLTAVMLDSKEKELRRSGAQALLVDFLRDDPVELTDRFLNASIEQIQDVIKQIDSNQNTIRPLLNEVLNEPLSMESSDWEMTARRKANAAAFQLRFGASSEQVWSVFKSDGIPDARTQLIQRVVPFQVDPQLIAQRLQFESDTSIRCGLVMALGEFAPDQLSGDLRDRTVTLIKGWFHTANHASLRSTSLWFLRQWREEKTIKESLTKELPEDPGRDWYVSSEGHTMVRLLPHRPDASYQLDASIGEVTVEQFRRFDANCKQEAAGSPTPDCPVLWQTYHRAVAYCNWLSMQAGLSEDQWCYPEREDGPGVAADMFPDYPQRTGYRLPTAEEWFYLESGGSKASFSFGNDIHLVHGYARFLDQGRRGWPLGTTKPNDFGVFDMITGSREWISEKDPKDPKRVGLCGNSFRDNFSEDMKPHVMGYDLPDLSYSFNGFRVVRSRPNKIGTGATDAP